MKPGKPGGSRPRPRDGEFKRGPSAPGGFRKGPGEFRKGPSGPGGFRKGPGGPGGSGPGGFRKGPRPDGFRRGPEDSPRGEFGRPHLGKDELRYHGFNACLALWENRPKDVIRVYVDKSRSEDFAVLLEWCAKHKKAYHLVTEPELERLTDTVHHDGICMIAKERMPLRDKELYGEIGGGRTLILFLDGVGNPHNLGAILRTAAHFGVKYVAGAADELPRISPAANRTSEGGAEHVSLVRVEDTERFFDRLISMGFQVYAFDPGEKAVPLYETRLAEKSIFVMGAEVTGLSGLVKELADTKVKIPGTGVIESLNVSVAAALAMAEFQRQGLTKGSVRIVKKNP